MVSIEEKISALETKVTDLNGTIEGHEKILEDKTDKNDVRVLIDESLQAKKIVNENEVIILIEDSMKGKSFVGREEMENILHEAQLKMLKWMIGTGVSIAAVVVGILKLYA
ncbi:hypothetical protein [Salirhabdus salicampi]|uniref:hypothetical protein n=1 Tax=Salirhabdus salicampi TaxID=476102 RepID=UPI0020C46D71|nr:hypothetical protein [Salirhabdus salicampi]MCP8615806.1 hypothetical protein [Salirhabdus salicampi]